MCCVAAMLIRLADGRIDGEVACALWLNCDKAWFLPPAATRTKNEVVVQSYWRFIRTCRVTESVVCIAITGWDGGVTCAVLQQ